MAEFIAFPIRVGKNGWLNRSESPIESLMPLLGIIAGTSRAGWRGSEQFGAREKLQELQKKQDARLIAIKQLNQALEDLGIDWARVDNIELEASAEYGVSAYVFTISDPSKGVEAQRLEMKTDI